MSVECPKIIWTKFKVPFLQTERSKVNHIIIPHSLLISISILIPFRRALKELQNGTNNSNCFFRIAKL